MLILAFAFATAVAAQIRVPVPGSPVPVTLQTAVVLLAGLRLGAHKGALSQAVYIAAGALGLPFFAGAAGAGVLVGPTGGYLIGFVLAAWTAGFLGNRLANRRARSASTTLVATWVVTFVASLVVFIPGVTQLKLVTGATWQQAIAMGLIPFIIGDLVKVTLTTTTFALTKRR